MSGEGERDAAAKPGAGEIPTAPTSLPLPRTRASRGGRERTKLEVTLEVVTPILGGSAETRELDEIDVIRPATVRGHLRFWWRALYGHKHEGANLYKEESELWGRAATEPEGGRSGVELRLDVQQRAGTDDSEIHPIGTQGAYALWPGRKEQRKQIPTAKRWRPGTRFRLTLVVPTDRDREAEVREAVRAWILFGGYGGRTRRGLGSFRVVENERAWLPAETTRSAVEACFGRDVFLPSDRAVGDTPWLAGASLHVGRTSNSAQQAWLAALEWLSEFRQGTAGGARQPPREGRPSISNWPEADKVRRLSQPKKARRWAHTPRHNATPVWPRAAFGLPIIGQFQDRSREPTPGWRPGDRTPKYLGWHELPSGHGNHGDEPEPFEICWQARDVRGRLVPMERLASPLIVKALPLAGGKFAPCALWLHRAYPQGEVVLLRKQGPDARVVVQGSAASFDHLVAAGDTPRFPPLDAKHSLREAFLGWLLTTQHTKVVAP